MQRFFNSIDYVEQHLFEEMHVDDIAQAAYFSTYHYCRMFKALVGHSVMDYVRKRRLSEAADLLAKTDTPIIDIALQCQFDSQEAFTRAFKQMFNVTPGKYRKINEPFRLLFKRKFNDQTLQHRQQQISLEPQIIVKPTMNTIGIPTIYDYDDFDLPFMWSVFKVRKQEIPNIVGRYGFGIYENYQERIDDTERTVFTYLCCVEVSSLDIIPEGMIGRIIPEQRYAVFTHRGLMDTMDETLRYIWGIWLPKSPYDYAERPDFELYSQRFHRSKNPEIDLYIPVKSK